MRADVDAVGMEARKPPGTQDVRPSRRGRIAAALFGVGVGVAAVGVSSLALTVSDGVTYTPLIGAVLVAVWFAGGVGGGAALVTGWALAEWAMTSPRMSFEIHARDDLVRWVTSLLVGILVAAVGVLMRRAHQRAADAAHRAETSRLWVKDLQELGALLSAALTPGEVARVLVHTVPAAIGAQGGALGLVEGEELVIVDPGGGSTSQTLRPGYRMSLSDMAPITTAARESRPVWVQRRREFVSSFPDGAALAPYASGALAVPVFVGDRLAGALGFPFTAADAVTDDVRSFAEFAAKLGGQALERADLYSQERTSREALDRILAVAPRFHHGETPEAVSASVCAEARRTFGCDVAQVWTPHEDELEVNWRDPPSPVIPPGTRIPYADFPGLIEEMQALRSMFVPDAQAHTRGQALRHARELGLFSSLRVPIVIDARFERVLALQWKRVIPEPARSVLAVVRRFADQAGLALEQVERRIAQEQTRSLQAVTEALSAAVTPGDVGAAIVRQGVAALGARAATVYALSENGEQLELVASDGYAQEVVESWGTIPIEAETPLTDAIRSGEMIVCESFDEISARYPWFDRTEESFVAAPLIAAGRPVGSIFMGTLRNSGRGSAEIGVVVGLARQAAQALDRAQLFEREQASASRVRKLQSVTAALSTAVTIKDVCRTCLEHAAAAVAAQEGVIVLRGADEQVLSVVAGLGAASSASRVPEDAAAPIADSIRAGRACSTGSWIALPIASGALALRLSMPTLAPGDAEWLATLVSQGGQALDRAGRYEAERLIAETLQRSVLPERLPTLHGVELAARYLPGTIGVDVGGDWYDAFQLESGSVGLVVGDVVGKGVQAAAMMGQLRNALRAFSSEHDDPHDVVARLARLVDGMVEAPFATLAYLVLEPHSRVVRYVVAGHPPPLVLEPDGRTRFLEGGRTLPIGVDGSFAFQVGQELLDVGSTIVLYTDGLVERRGCPLDDGLAKLQTLASGRTDHGPERIVDRILSEMLGDEPRRDDVAMLCVRLAGAALDDLELSVPSDQEGLVGMRADLRDWLERADLEDDSVAEDVVLAVWEACANAVEHAQDPAELRFRLHAMLDDTGWLRVEVLDSGSWKPGEGSPDRGLGLRLMRSLMERVDVRHTEHGTSVVLERRLDRTTAVV